MPTFSGHSQLTAAVSFAPALSGVSSFTTAGLIVQRTQFGYYYISKYVGEPNVPHDIQRQRRYCLEVMRRMGQPVLVKHMFNDRDFSRGLAAKSDNFDAVYGQVRNYDPLSHGIGYVSNEKAADEWISPEGEIVTANVQPAGHVAAPKYRGFGPGFITYIIEPDKADDYYKESPTGALIKVQEATAQTGWFPDISDNDLIINVTLSAGWEIVEIGDRYQAKIVNPISIRGTDRRGRREWEPDRGNSHLIEQQFEMSLVPENHTLQHVEADR